MILNVEVFMWFNQYRNNMEIDQKTLNEMIQLRDKVSKFIRDTSTPIKKQYSDNIKEYLDKFIKFPGSLSIISVFFVSSDLVQNYTLALFGVGLVISSLLVALNVFRLSVDNDHSFYEYIVNLEKPIMIFSRRLTQFSREETEEKLLLESYESLQNSYKENSEKADDEKDNSKHFRFVKNSINVSFYMLTIGIIICFISAINFC